MRPSDIRELTDAELLERISDLKEERFRLGFQKGMMDLENPRLVAQLRKDIARMKTILHERAQGVVRTDDAGSRSD